MLTLSQKTVRTMRKTTIFGQLLLLAALMSNTSILNAVTYKWVDEEGNTHYTQSPPPGDTKAQTIAPPPSVNPEHAKKQVEKRKKILQDASDGRTKSSEEKKKASEEKARNQAKCEQAKKRLASYQRPRVNLVDKDGNYTVAGEDKRQAEIKKSQDLINELCK
ncbi:MAG: DUF4124 domain-containing protein [Gammaproteobacteria bacterium]|nr:DUF4124 domain-containing protein [Gammaproteobacteria bacterium]